MHRGAFEKGRMELSSALQLPLAKIVFLAIYHLALRGLDSGGKQIDLFVNSINYKYTNPVLLHHPFPKRQTDFLFSEAYID